MKTNRNFASKHLMFPPQTVLIFSQSFWKVLDFSWENHFRTPISHVSANKAFNVSTTLKKAKTVFNSFPKTKQSRQTENDFSLPALIRNNVNFLF